MATTEEVKFDYEPSEEPLPERVEPKLPEEVKQKFFSYFCDKCEAPLTPQVQRELPVFNRFTNQMEMVMQPITVLTSSLGI